jgi:magnesium chelatase subunit D
MGAIKDGGMSKDFLLYPFAAIVGQEKMKTALLANAVDPEIGGLLIKGERGTAKSSAARALAELLPAIEIVADCPFSCDPRNSKAMCDSCLSAWEEAQPLPVASRPPSFVTLPLNATEDRVVGTIDIERAIKNGERSFEPGILAAANRSILYVDEVNLLEDHIVDVLLDSAAMGLNIVEREGVSFRHPASFLLVGSMNPEEGELRPQLEDRFGLCVEIKGETDASYRVEIMRRRDEFAADPHLFRARFESQQCELREKVLAARALLPRIELSDGVLDMISSIALELDVSGHRADIATCRTARALAALEGKAGIGEEHVRAAAEMAFLHRLRKTPFDEAPGRERLVRATARNTILVGVPGEGLADSEGSEPVRASSSADTKKGEQLVEITIPAGEDAGGSEVALEGSVFKSLKAASGRRSSALTDSKEGRRVGQRAPGDNEALKPSSLAIDATLRAAAMRSAEQGKPFAVEKQDLRKAVHRRKVGNLILFVLDASASMGSRERIESTRTVVSELLIDAYQKRDKVGLITFRDSGAQLVLAPTSSFQIAKMRLKELATGGATPLSHGLAMALQLAKREIARSSQVYPLLVFITDGCGNVPISSGDPIKESISIASKIREEKLPCVVFDTFHAGALRKRGPAAVPHARRIAEAMGARYYALAPLKAEDMISRLEKSLSS